MIDKMVRQVRKIVQTKYYYASESESDGSDEEWVEEMTDDESDSESDATTVIFNDEDWEIVESDEEEVSDSEDGTDYESETEPESDSEELDDPKPYFGKGFRVYFDSHADKKFFMKAFGFHDA